MARRIAKLGKHGQVTIPAEIRSRLGIRPGTRVCVTIENGCIVLEMASAALVDKTRGMLKGGPSLSTALKRMRPPDKW
jgi:AbrB family looped-hinge helix DNA binding protein